MHQSLEADRHKDKKVGWVHNNIMLHCPVVPCHIVLRGSILKTRHACGRVRRSNVTYCDPNLTHGKEGVLTDPSERWMAKEIGQRDSKFSSSVEQSLMRCSSLRSHLRYTPHGFAQLHRKILGPVASGISVKEVPSWSMASPCT